MGIIRLDSGRCYDYVECFKFICTIFTHGRIRGVYEYLRLCFGNFFSFLYGWTDFAIIGSASVAALAFIFSQTINSFIVLPNPFQQWESVSVSGFIYPFKDSGIKILTITTIMLLTWVNYRGVKESGFVNNIFSLAKIVGILSIIVLALFYFA